MAVQSRMFKVGDEVVCNPNHPKIKANKGDSGWTDQYYQFLKGYPARVVEVITPGDLCYRLENEAGFFYTEEETEVIAADAQVVVETTQAEYTGGSSNYYKVFVQSPTTLESPYEAECNDIIEALKMTFAEGNAFKAIWRKAKARQGVQKKGYDNGLYDSEKVVFFGERMVVEAKQ